MTGVRRSESWIGWVLAALGGAVIVVTVVHGLIFDGGGSSRTSGAQTPGTHVGPPPTAAAGKPANAHNRRGALAAAVSFVCSGRELLDVDPLSAEAMVRSMAATATADDQVRSTAARLRQLRERMAAGSGPMTLVQGVIASRLDSYSATHARLALWSVSVTARADVVSPQATWAISTLDLVWERDGWRLSRETVQPGPAPLLDDSTAPATPTQLQTSLDGFTQLGGTR
jgi:hypothetical protein